MAMDITTTNIMSTMQTRTSVLPVWWMGWVALLLVVFAVPSVTARFLLLPQDQTRLSLMDGNKITAHELLDLESSRRQVVGWFPSNEILNDLAMVNVEAGSRVESQKAKAFYKQAEQWQRRALTVSPTDAFGWYRLAFLLFAEQGPNEKVAHAWRQSMASAPYEPRLVLPRLQMAMSLGAWLKPEDRMYATSRLIREYWVQDRDNLVRLAVHGSYVSDVEKALETDTMALEDFRQRVAAYNNRDIQLPEQTAP